MECPNDTPSAEHVIDRVSSSSYLPSREGEEILDQIYTPDPVPRSSSLSFIFPSCPPPPVITSATVSFLVFSILLPSPVPPIYPVPDLGVGNRVPEEEIILFPLSSSPTLRSQGVSERVRTVVSFPPTLPQRRGVIFTRVRPSGKGQTTSVVLTGHRVSPHRSVFFYPSLCFFMCQGELKCMGRLDSSTVNIILKTESEGNIRLRVVNLYCPGRTVFVGIRVK